MFIVYMSFIKKLFSVSLLTIIAIAGFSSLVSSPAYAASGLPTGTTTSNTEICGNSSANCATTGGASFDGGAQGVVGFLLNIARLVVYLVGAIAVLFLVYGGIMYLTAGGDDAKVKAARSIITNAVIGLIVAIVAFSIVTIVQGLVGGQFLGN